jgi:nucleoside phosphorylase
MEAPSRPESRATQHARTRVFISYSHSDEHWRQLIAQHLAVLERHGLLDVWDDRRIGVGEDWFRRIDENMSSAKVALLLISATFLDSEFVHRQEVPRLLQEHTARGMTVYPLLIRPCAWQEVPWLSRLQMRPEDTKAVSHLKGAKRDEVLARVAREIGSISRAGAPPQPPATEDAATAASNPANAALPPTITRQPSSAVITQGGSATLSVVASGSLLEYQWFANGAAVSNDSQATLTTPTGGQYFVRVSNPVGSVDSATVTVTVTSAPPFITTQPASTIVPSGDSATFTVVATGTNLRYQWWNADGTIPNQNAASYSTGTAGRYFVVVANETGSITSAAATLTVIPRVVAPNLTTQPAPVAIYPGQAARLAVSATGTPLTFQWFNASGVIANATSPQYTTSVAGTYYVVVSNSAGRVESDRVTVTVVSAPVITTNPQSVSINYGQTATLSVVATGLILAYQWQLNGAPINGATSTSYTTDKAGTYTVVVVNSAGSVTSSAATVTVTSAPTITTQPQSVTIAPGQTATLSIIALGTAPLTYQWRNASGNVTGATSASYTTGTAGIYNVVVSNAVGSVTSSAATVAVTAGSPVTITTQPQSVTINLGQLATLSVIATGTAPLSYQWRNASGNIVGATSSTYATAVAGVYTVVVMNATGSITSNPATVTVASAPTITTQPQSVTINTGQTATLAVVASGTAALMYQWRRDGTAITGATSATYVTGTAGSYTAVVSNTAGSVMSSAAVVTITPAPLAPTITAQPHSVTINAGQATTLSVVAAGTAPLLYQWRRDGAAIAGATSASYTTGSAGSYSVAVANSAGTVLSLPATVTVVAPPTITTQPQSVTITADPWVAALTVVATGSAPLMYQWRHNGNNLAGATNASVTVGVPGDFAVVVSNSAGSVTSSLATVDIAGIPLITTQPQSATITLGQSTTLSVVASGAPSLSYQWRHDGADIAGATSATYDTSTAGTYTLAVSNGYGTVTSSAAVIEVTPAATALLGIAAPSASVAVDSGQTMTRPGVPARRAPRSRNLPRDGTATQKVLLLMATAIEAAAVRAVFSPGREPDAVYRDTQTYRDYGQHGAVHVFGVSSAGTGAPDAQNTVNRAIQEIDPKTIVAVGIAYGVDDTRQRIGDVLAATGIIGYDIARHNADGTVHHRQPLQESSRSLRQRVTDRLMHGAPQSARGPWPRIELGVLLSGGGLIDNRETRDRLVRERSAAAGSAIIGGEMEATGVAAAAAADSDKRDWIVIKAICDFADGKKNHPNKDEHQRHAAWNAALVVKSLFDPEGLANVEWRQSTGATKDNAPSIPVETAAVGTTTAARLQLEKSISDARSAPSSSADNLLAAFDPKIGSAHDAVCLLDKLEAIPFIGQLQDACTNTYLKPGARVYLDESAARVATAMLTLGLERRVRERLGEHDGSVPLAVDAFNPTLTSIVGALLSAAGLVLRGDSTSFAPTNVLVDAAPVEFMHRSYLDQVGAEMLVRGRELHDEIPRDQTLRSLAGNTFDPAEARDHNERFHRREGARFVAEVPSERLPQGRLEPEFANDLWERYGLRCFVTVITDKAADRNTVDIAREAGRFVGALLDKLDKARRLLPSRQT